jgi:hypothetical protein
MTGVSLTLFKCTPWVLVIVDPCPCGFASDFECLSFICLAESWMSKLTHTEACFGLQVWLNLGDRWSTHQICSLHTINTKYRVKKYAEIYIARVLCLHGVLKTIVSDRGSQFVARFWEQLHASLGTHLTHSSAYHPQMDGQTERVNQILEHMLRAYVMEYPSSWDKNLSWA